MNLQKLKLVYNTVKYLRFKQVYYRVFYLVRNKLFKIKYTKPLTGKVNSLHWKNYIFNNDSYKNNQFEFLNLPFKFKEYIDWNFSEFGKLWTYNLNYFDFLNQNNITVEEGVFLIKDYIRFNDNLKDGKEPYPTSLRNINWIKFLSSNEINDESINQSLYNHYQNLINNLEYHLLGNHLLENGFSLLFGSFYFNDTKLYKKGYEIIYDELNEEVLNDGAHFELSPMYHQILLYRLLDCIFLIKHNRSINFQSIATLESFLEEKAVLMLSWISKVTFKNGDIPMVNDSAFDVSISTERLIDYASKIDIRCKEVILSDSGYRKFLSNKYELFVDVGEVGPTYQPGHAHADTFNFILYVNNRPIIVDPGLSTYEINGTRKQERSTFYHNTVQVNDTDSSQVWSGFRVANRANVKVLKDTSTELEAIHNGYKLINCMHKRLFMLDDKSIIKIKDELTSSKKAKASFHLHPEIKISEITRNFVELVNGIKLEFAESKSILIEDYNYAIGFNKTILAKKIIVDFSNRLTTDIRIS